MCNKQYFFKSALYIIFYLFINVNGFAQNNTYILIRHAEKDTTVAGYSMMNADPPLNNLGIKRAKKLVKILRKYAIDSIYTTNFIRTKTTVQPLSVKIALPLNIYNYKALPQFANQLLSLKNKTVLIVGHSNSTPQLVNLLTKQQTYQSLDEAVYNKIFIVTIANNTATVKILNY
jgi:2,3-bisphosphoglycerate-dependent phosphoglycerate mutase